jgi:hypothetical protein
MILNNLFLFILPDFCTRVFRLIWNRHTRIDWSIWNGKKCPLLGARCCVCFDTSPLASRGKQKRDPWDYRWTLAAKRSSLFYFFVCRSTLNAKEKKTHLDAIFNGWKTKRAKSDSLLSRVPVGAKLSALKIDSARSIELKFIWYWTKVKIFLCIPPDHHRSFLLFPCTRFVITAYAAFMISIYTSSSIIIS